MASCGVRTSRCSRHSHRRTVGSSSCVPWWAAASQECRRGQLTHRNITLNILQSDWLDGGKLQWLL